MVPADGAAAGCPRGSRGASVGDLLQPQPGGARLRQLGRHREAVGRLQERVHRGNHLGFRCDEEAVFLVSGVDHNGMGGLGSNPVSLAAARTWLRGAAVIAGSESTSEIPGVTDWSSR